jgi:hypothetical protein
LNKSIGFVGEKTPQSFTKSLTKVTQSPFQEHTSSNMAEANTFATRLTALGFEQLVRNTLMARTHGTDSRNGGLMSCKVDPDL